MTPEAIREMIESHLPDARIQVAGDDGVHFQALVVSDAFEGKPVLSRHRMVYDALGERMGGEVHALSLKTLTPAEHQRAN